MKRLGLLLTATAMFAFVGCKNDKKNLANPSDMNDTIDVTTTNRDMDRDMDMDRNAMKTITVMMEPKSNSKVAGEVKFIQDGNKVKMEANFTGLKPGTHAIHLHEKADCSAADGSSAGGHWNPTHQKHGKWGDSDGYHKGDIGNFEADSDGNGSISFDTDEWCIGCGDETMDILGKSVIVHDGKDDFKSQPAGDAGDRVSCGGVIE